MQYKDIGDYIRQKCRAHGLSIVDTSEQMGFSRGYLPSIINGKFTPSREGCVKIANFFGDSPNIALELAGYFFPEEDVQQDEEIARVAAALSLADRQLLLEIAYILKERSDRKHIARRRLKTTEENGQTKT
jgi:transcriptional regulator with XRE-family HTH domain